jgi:hypothetical protein
VEEGYTLNMESEKIFAGLMRLDRGRILRNDHKRVDGDHPYSNPDDIPLHDFWRKGEGKNTCNSGPHN